MRESLEAEEHLQLTKKLTLTSDSNKKSLREENKHKSMSKIARRQTDTKYLERSSDGTFDAR